MSTSSVETTAVGFTTRLKYVYWGAYIVIAANVLALMAYGPVAGSVLWDEVNEDRLTSWTFWWWWGQTLAFYTPILTLWLMSHTWFGAYYTIHLALTFLAIGIHVTWAVMVIDVFNTCTPRFCDGDQAIAALNPLFGMAPDLALWGYTGVVGSFFVCDLFYLFFNYYLHRKTEFRTQLEVAAASRAPDMARSYMYRSQYGGARWLFDAFSPPGSHAYGSFSPYSGGYSRMAGSIGDAEEHRAAYADALAKRPYIGADIMAIHAGSPAPTLDDLYHLSPWSILSANTHWIGALFARRYASPADQFRAVGISIDQPAPTAAYAPVASAPPHHYMTAAPFQAQFDVDPSNAML
jgi:hypothetical protein